MRKTDVRRHDTRGICHYLNSTLIDGLVVVVSMAVSFGLVIWVVEFATKVVATVPDDLGRLGAGRRKVSVKARVYA